MQALLVRLRVPLGFAAGLVYLALARPSAGLLAACLPLVALGQALRLWASGHIAKNRMLTTSGPYAHVRHPLYLGSLLMVAGFAIASGSLLLAAVLLAAFGLVYAPVARREDASLSAKFPAEYAVWRAAVPALLPRLTPWREAASGAGFRWEAVRRHREYRSLLGALLVSALLALRAFSLRAP